MFIRILVEILFLSVLLWGLVLMGRKYKKNGGLKKFSGLLLVLADIVGLLFLIFAFRQSLYSFRLPEGELHWTDQRPVKDSVKMCVPAAYSTPNGKILGQYLKDGNTYGDLRTDYGRASIKNNIFYADYRWHSGEGFQQHTLVLDSEPKHFRDKRYKVRRAIAKNSAGEAFLVQSHFPMTLNEFALKLSQNYTNALNLDMGHCGYGYCKWHNICVPLSFWTYINMNEQTNWLIVK